MAENGYRSQGRSYRQKRGQHIVEMENQIAHHAEDRAKAKSTSGYSSASPTFEAATSTKNHHAPERGQAGAHLDITYQTVGAGQSRSVEQK